jgi:hypothetical protein
MKHRRLPIAVSVISLLLALTLISSVSADVTPPEVSVTLPPGGSTTVVKSVHVPPVPPMVDVVFALDVSFSMDEELDLVKAHVTNIIDALAALSGVDLQVGVVSHVDYPGQYSACGYSGTYGDDGDWAFLVEEPVTSDFAAVDAATQALTLGHGKDGPQNYARVMWESAQADSGIGYRDEAFKVLVFFLDNLPHDCDINQGVPGMSGTYSTGVDPGRNEVVDGYLGAGGDDIDFQDHALADMITNNVRQITMFSGGDWNMDYWEHWSGLTGGSAVQLSSSGEPPPGTDLPTVIVEAVEEAAMTPVVVTPVPTGCGLIDITFDPPQSGPAVGCEVVVFQETISVPEEMELGEYCCQVEFWADGALIGVQDVCVRVVEEAVGGVIIPTDKVGLMTPWIVGMGALIVVVGLSLAAYHRRYGGERARHG